jgi:tRNA (mo5U34)-methyltransferase
VGLFEHALALGRQPDIALAAGHDGNTQVLLKLVDAARKRGLGDIAGLRRAGEVLLAGKGCEILKLPDIHGRGGDHSLTEIQSRVIRENDTLRKVAVWLQMTNLQEKLAAQKNWRHRIELAPGVFTPGSFNPQLKLGLLELPERLDGKRVLDIGTADGFFAFECERRGAAEVVAMDVRPPGNFNLCKEAMNSTARYVQGSLYEEELGQFDLVLCLNVLYHVKEVHLAIERLRRYCAGDIIICTMALDNAYYRPDGSTVPLAEIAPELKDAALMQYLPAIDGWEDRPSYWQVSSGAMLGMMKSVGFAVDRWKLGGANRIYIWAH